MIRLDQKDDPMTFEVPVKDRGVVYIDGAALAGCGVTENMSNEDFAAKVRECLHQRRSVPEYGDEEWTDLELAAAGSRALEHIATLGKERAPSLTSSAPTDASPPKLVG